MTVRVSSSLRPDDARYGPLDWNLAGEGFTTLGTGKKNPAVRSV